MPYTFNPFSGTFDYYASVPAESDPLSLHLNQSTPQDISGGQPDFLAGLRAGSTNQFSIDASGNVVTSGTLKAGAITSQNTAATSWIKLILGWNVPAGNKGAWIDMSTDGPSGLGDGGAGANAWIATVSGAGQWFTDSLVGDICYRRGLNRLLFGNQNEEEEDMPATLIISGNVATIKNGVYYSSDGSAGITATITTARLTPVTGSQGSMTFKNGILTAQTQAN